MSLMLTIFNGFFLAEVRHGFPDFPRRGFCCIGIILGYQNLPWLIAPIVGLPVVARQSGYLYRPTATAPADLIGSRRKKIPNTV